MSTDVRRREVIAQNAIECHVTARDSRWGSPASEVIRKRLVTKNVCARPPLAEDVPMDRAFRSNNFNRQVALARPVPLAAMPPLDADAKYARFSCYSILCICRITV